MFLSCDERLRARVLDEDRGAVEAALALMERHDPRSLPQAMRLVSDGPPPSPACFETVAEAWDRYFHMRSMPWD